MLKRTIASLLLFSAAMLAIYADAPIRGATWNFRTIGSHSGTGTASMTLEITLDLESIEDASELSMAPIADSKSIGSVYARDAKRNGGERPFIGIQGEQCISAYMFRWHFISARNSRYSIALIPEQGELVSDKTEDGISYSLRWRVEDAVIPNGYTALDTDSSAFPALVIDKGNRIGTRGSIPLEAIIVCYNLEDAISDGYSDNVYINVVAL